MIFASDPWGVIGTSIKRDCPAPSQEAARAFLKQAEDNYRTAATGSILGAKPVLLYYSFLNLAKAYILTVGQQSNLDVAQHGIREKLAQAGRELVDASLRTEPTVQNNLKVFDEFYRAVVGNSPGSAMNHPMPHVLAQIVTGHRLWCIAKGAGERFLSIDQINVLANANTGDAWLTIDLDSKDVTRAGLNASTLLGATGLGTAWAHVNHPDTNKIRFEQTGVSNCSAAPATTLLSLVRALEPNVWTTVTSAPPYRKYYLYAPATGETALPQLLSMYALARVGDALGRLRGIAYARGRRGAAFPCI